MIQAKLKVTIKHTKYSTNNNMIQVRPISRILILILVHLSSVTSAQLDFHVKEEQHAPVLLGNIAKQAGITSIPDLDFSLLNRKDLFDIDESTGDFRTKTNLDRESLCGPVPTCVMVTSVAVSSSPDFFQRYSINVFITDINDQRPSFGIVSLPRSISERADVNTTIKLPVASDGDYEPTFKVQNYRLEPEQHKTFGLVVARYNKSDGTAEFDLNLRLLEKIDREKIGTYTLTLVASDGGSPSNEGKLQIVISVIDENDNRPEFSENNYEKSVKEITGVGTTVLTVSVRDPDDGENGRVGFEFPADVDRKILKFFEVNSMSGDVMLVKSLENEGGTSFVFKIKAFDHGTPIMFSEVTVKINVEDTINNPPSIRISQWRFKNDNAIVSEDVVVGTKIALIDVVDTDSGDNGKTQCKATSDYFSLEEYNSPGEYTVSVGRDLDRERLPVHVITIQCVDKGVPPLSSSSNLTVLVEDVNDNRPEFTMKSYEMTVTENQDVGQFVGNVVASDLDEGLNGLIRYSVESALIEFKIDEFNGNLYTSIKGLDREVKDKYIFQVFAFDVGLTPLTATTTVTINIDDENDESPTFDNSSYHFIVSESSKVNSIIGQVSARDLDLRLGGLIEYVLMHSPLHPDPPYSLSKEDGTLKLIKSLDYELTKQYNFVITALDLGIPPRNSSVEIQIEVQDENDNDPVLVFPSKDNFSVTLNRNMSPGHEVITVLAHDPDTGENGRLTYSFTASSNAIANIFRINKDTGLLTLVSSLIGVNSQSYNITLIVQDNGVPQRANHAVLQLEITKQAEGKRSKESYTIIVITMVCVTLFIAATVFFTLCFIRYTDNRKSHSNKESHNSNFKPIIASPEDFLQEPETKHDFDQNIISSSFISNKCSLPSPNRRLIASKKSVTFDNAVTSSDYPNAIEPANIPTNLNSDKYISKLAGSAHQVQYDCYIPRTFCVSTFDETPYNKSYLHRYSPTVTSTVTPTDPPYNMGDNPERNNLGTVNPSTRSSPKSKNNFKIGNIQNNQSLRTNHHADTLLNECPRSNTHSRTVDLSANEISKSKNPTTKVDSSANDAPGYMESRTADEMIDMALEKHNALVRSMVNKNRRSPDNRRDGPGSSGHDLDICSSSSVETSDSGHGGSELDISVAKNGV